ncbi:hypothetical protein WG66_002638 [Moniliophthora roreri]|nr:hypothetical protein WG66_002638 [Moniliophthora roreri]
MRRIACEICGGTCHYLDFLHTWKEVRGVVQDDALLMSIPDWLAYIVEPPWFQSSRRQPSRYLEDLLACLVTHVDHYRSEKWDSTHEIIVAHLQFGEDRRSIQLERAKKLDAMLPSVKIIQRINTTILSYNLLQSPSMGHSTYLTVFHLPSLSLG